MKMYDSTRPSLIPSTAPIVAGYNNGDFAWSQLDFSNFPTPYKLTISVKPTESADILDVEHGDAKPTQVAHWLTLSPTNRTVYCSKDTAWPAVRYYLNIAKSQITPYYWIADYLSDKSEHLVAGSSATQYGDFGTYDLSITDNVWPMCLPRFQSQSHQSQSQSQSQEDTMSTLEIFETRKGQLVVVAKRTNGNLLVFREGADSTVKGGWGVMDVTDAIKNVYNTTYKLA